jgi:serine/threonine protein kinase
VINQYLSKYRVDERLGSGTFATVYRCFDPDLETTCAVKVLLENWSEDPSARSWFLNEARIMFGIEHPAMLRIFTSGELEDGRPYFVMEYADEGSLAELIRSRRVRNERFSVAEALEISVAIAEGLNVAHERGLVHRDLKPSNVLFRSPAPETSSSGRSIHTGRHVKLADFGLARRLEEGANSLAGAGTPHYIAPEQARGRPDELPDVRNDIYSAATVLYEMLAGQVPFPYQSMAQVITAHLNEDPTPVQDLAPHVPDEVAQLVHSGLAKDLEDRIPTAIEWRNRLLVLRTALNPDGTIADWGMEPELENVGDSALSNNRARADHGEELVAIPSYNFPGLLGGELSATSIRRSADVDVISPGASEGKSASRRQDLMVPYVIGAAVVGLLVVAILGYALADLVTEGDGTIANGQNSITDVAESDDNGSVAVEPRATSTPDSGSDVEPTPTVPAPTPTAEVEPSPTAEPTPVEDTEPSTDYIASTLQNLPGRASTAVVLPSGDSVGEGGERPVPAASTIKLWIAAVTFEEAELGNLDLLDEHTIREEDQAFGTGILNQEQFLGQSINYAELVETMLLHSDNSAANMLVEQVGGMDRINEYAQENGYEDTRMQRMLGDLNSEQENYTSARDGALFIERLIAGEVVDQSYSEELQAILERRADNGGGMNFFGRELPSGVKYAHISGLLPGVRNEVGYFYSEERNGFVVVSFMLGDLTDESTGEMAISSAVGEINSHLSTVAMN